MANINGKSIPGGVDWGGIKDALYNALQQPYNDRQAAVAAQEKASSLTPYYYSDGSINNNKDQSRLSPNAGDSVMGQPDPAMFNSGGWWQLPGMPGYNAENPAYPSFNNAPALAQTGGLVSVPKKAPVPPKVGLRAMPAPRPVVQPPPRPVVAPPPPTLAQQVAAMTPQQLANQNAQALTALKNNQTSYTANSGALMPTVAMNGAIRNSYGDNVFGSSGAGSASLHTTGST